MAARQRITVVLLLSQGQSLLTKKAEELYLRMWPCARVLCSAYSSDQQWNIAESRLQTFNNKIIKNWNLYSLCECVWGGGRPQKALPEPLRPNCEPAGLPPPPPPLRCCWYMFWLLRYGIFWFLFNSVRLFDEQFLPNCEPVDGRHPAPPPGICLPHQCTVGKKVLRFSWKIHQELKTIDFLNVFTIPRCSIFRVF